MVFLPNPPKADKSLRLPCEMRSLFLWGYTQKNNPRDIRHTPVEDPGALTGLVPSLQRGGYFFRMPSDFA